MQWLRKLGAILSLCFVFFGSTGFYVFVHQCQMDGVETSLYFKSEHICQDEVEVESCCQKPEPEEKNDCCSDELKIFQVDYDYVESIPTFPFISANFELQELSFVLETIANLAEEEKGQIKINDPPTVSGRMRVIQNQQFRC
jgi:hypothetical protein